MTNFETGDKLRSVRNPDVTCEILSEVAPPTWDKRYKHRMWLVKYDNGKKRRWSKSHLKKYYVKA